MRFVRNFAWLLMLSCAEQNKVEVRVEGTEPGDCSDGADNDADGLWDCEDSSCSNAPECLDVEDTGNVSDDICSSLYFQGDDHFLKISSNDNPEMVPTSDFTVESWLFWDGLHGARYQNILYFGQPSGDTRVLGLYVLDTVSDCGGSSGQVLLSWDTIGQSNCLVSPETLPSNEWVHTAVVFDQSTFKLFINGVLVASEIGSIPATEDDDFYIGTREMSLDTNDLDFYGNIDKLHYMQGVKYTTDFTPGFASVEESTTFLFDFSEGTGESTVDETGAFSGVMNNSTWSSNCPEED